MTSAEKIKDNIKEFIGLAEEMTIAFYQRKETKGYELYEKFLDVLPNIIDELAYLNDKSIIQVDIVKINSMLEKALQALQVNDTVTFADVIQFEIISEMKMYYKKL